MIVLLYSNKTPVHVCQTEAIRDAVRQDLLRRGVTEFHAVPSNNPIIHIDFGGCIIAGEQPHSVPDTPIQFFLQHYSHLRAAVARAREKPREGNYYKIHGEGAYCIDLVTFSKLDTYLQTQEAMFLQTSAAQTEALLERIARIGKD